jgi:hypothetical protein
MSLAEQMGTVVLKDPDGAVVDRFEYQLEGGGGSATRPSANSYLVLDHCAASDQDPCENLSPGRPATAVESYTPCLGVIVTLSGVVDSDNTPIQGALVVVSEHPDISWITPAEGTFQLDGIPSNEVVHVLTHPPGPEYWGRVATYQFFGSDLVDDFDLIAHWMIEAVSDALSITVDTEQGILMVKATPGTRVTLPEAPGAIAIAFDGADFSLDDVVPDGGEQVIFVNVPPGEATPELEPPLGIHCDTNRFDRDAFSPASILEGMASTIKYDCL